MIADLWGESTAPLVGELTMPDGSRWLVVQRELSSADRYSDLAAAEVVTITHTLVKAGSRHDPRVRPLPEVGGG